MDPKPQKYTPRDNRDVLDLVLHNPFAWVVSGVGETFSATPLPLRPRTDASGQLIGLDGHFARSNPQVERLRTNGRAALLFMGPHAYVSPSWMADRTQAPTWNYQSVAFDCTIELVDDEAGIEALLRDLIDAMEANFANRWSLDEMGERAKRLAKGVVGFHATILDQQAAFKLGQDERDDVLLDILKGLDGDGHTQLTALMRLYNPGRA